MKNDTPLYCPCCGAMKPEYDYPAGKRICSLCCTLAADTAVFLARETYRRELGVKQYTAQGRKQARIAKRLDLYAHEGKRCSACHNRKPVDAYDKCAPQSDGLQPNCRDCNKIWKACLKSGGVALWHATRAAMRANSPEGK